MMKDQSIIFLRNVQISSREVSFSKTSVVLLWGETQDQGIKHGNREPK